jgi:hypothetical protein
LRDFLEPGIRQLKAQRKRFYSAKLNSIVLPASNRDRTNVAGLIALLLFVLSIAAIPSVFALSTNQNAVAATPRDTVVQLTCRPSSVSVNAWTLCTEKVTDVGPGTPITPTGTVSFKSIKPGTFSGSASCTLYGDAYPGPATAHCSVAFKPSSTGKYVIATWYSGDANRAGQYVFASIKVTSPQPPPAG